MVQLLSLADVNLQWLVMAGFERIFIQHHLLLIVFLLNLSVGLDIMTSIIFIHKNHRTLRLWLKIMSWIQLLSHNIGRCHWDLLLSFFRSSLARVLLFSYIHFKIILVQLEFLLSNLTLAFSHGCYLRLPSMQGLSGLWPTLLSTLPSLVLSANTTSFALSAIWIWTFAGILLPLLVLFFISNVARDGIIFARLRIQNVLMQKIV